MDKTPETRSGKETQELWKQDAREHAIRDGTLKPANGRQWGDWRNSDWTTQGL